MVLHSRGILNINVNKIVLTGYPDYRGKTIIKQATIKDKDITKTGAIESNVKLAIANRFKKQGRSWSKKGVFSLLKVKAIILNGKWEFWWKKQRNHPIKLTPFKPPLSASHFSKVDSSSVIIQARIPALDGPNQDKPEILSNVVDE